MKLIIAEKPSLARNIASAIGSPEKKDGYIIAGDYYISYAFGHLFRLFEIEEYTGGEKKWDMSILPFYPKKFEFTLQEDPGIKKQFNIIKQLVSKSDEVINCGDADREGQVIIDLILHYAGNKKPTKRLWLPEQTEETIRQALKEVKPNKDYGNLLNAGLTRTYMDWIYGINLTRYLTLKVGNGQVWNVGRVVTAIVKAVYDRDLEIENFVPEKYFVVESKTKIKNEDLVLTSARKFKTKKEAEALAKEYNSHKGLVLDVQTKDKPFPRKKLFSLSTLQGVLGKQFKISPKECLDIVQTLYENGFVTYPRTNSEYLADAEKGKVQNIISKLKNASEFEVKEKNFDDKKIESHSAITPTTKIPKISQLNDKQMSVYKTIMNRFMAVFAKADLIVSEHSAIVKCSDEEIKIKGQRIKELGWGKFEMPEIKEGTIPPLAKGQEVDVNFIPIEKETRPPNAYSVKSLNDYLKNPFKNDEKTEDELYEDMKKGLEIGTEATRAPTIDKAIKQGFISLSKNIYHITEKGREYINFMDKLGIDISAEKTVEFQILIQAVFNKEKKAMEAVEESKTKVNEAFKKKDVNINSALDSIGKCPWCGERIIHLKGKSKESGKPYNFYGCSNKECSLAISSKVAGKNITESIVKTLLEKGETQKLSGFKSKKGKEFSAKLKLVKGEYNPQMEFD